MEPGRLARACLRIIDRYQRTEAAHVYDGSCRFDPSCCTFMGEAFATRRFLVAFVISAWRLIRCNPLLRRETPDPLARDRARRPRANGARTVFAVLGLTAFLVLLLGSAVFGQSITGDCTATLNGRSPSTLTSSHPLVVKRGDSISVSGTVPAALAGGDPTRIKSTTTVVIDLIDPILKYSAPNANPGTGPTWGGSVNPETYLKYGSGLYHGRGTATITSSTGSGTCAASGYIKFDGGKLIEAVAAGVGAVAAIGGVGSVGRKPEGVTADDFGKGVVTDFIDKPTQTVQAPTTTTIQRDSSYPFCCVIAMLAVPLVAIGMGGGEGGSVDEPPPPPTDQPAPGAVIASKRIYKHGHPILGFLSGLIFWACVTIVVQQAGIWTFTVWNAIALPVAGAILTAIRARIGRPYKIVTRVA